MSDSTLSSLRIAIVERREVDFTFGGAPVTVRPHILYVAKDGFLMVAGAMGDIPIVRVPVGQINNLSVSPRYFQPDPTFDFVSPDYDHPARVLARV